MIGASLANPLCTLDEPLTSPLARAWLIWRQTFQEVISFHLNTLPHGGGADDFQDAFFVVF